jgi:hypothetical protein
MDPVLVAAIKAYITQLLKEVIPDKDVKLSINIEISITKPNE